MRVLHKPRQIKISLSAVEIFDYFGSFDEIRYDNPKARSVLGNLLLNAAEGSSFLKDSKRLTIKVFPEDKGGCAIYFISSPKAKKFHKAASEYILEFTNCENLLLACEQLKIISEDILCSLYLSGNKYRLLLNGFLPAKILSLAYEYAERFFTSKLEKEKTREHWQAVCQDTPVKKICGL